MACRVAALQREHGIAFPSAQGFAPVVLAVCEIGNFQDMSCDAVGERTASTAGLTPSIPLWAFCGICWSMSAS
jgi:hypothetical protein